MMLNKHGVYVSGYENIKVETKAGHLSIRIGFDGSSWGWASGFLSKEYGWSFPLCDRDMVFPTRNDAVRDAVKKTVDRLQAEGPKGQYRSVIDALLKRHEPDQQDLFESVVHG